VVDVDGAQLDEPLDEDEETDEDDEALEAEVVEVEGAALDEDDNELEGAAVDEDVILRPRRSTSPEEEPCADPRVRAQPYCS
jgi:hypothetical protein